MSIRLDHLSLQAEKVIQKCIEIKGTFHIQTTNKEKIYNDGQKVNIDDEGVIKIRKASGRELFTSKLSGYFVFNVSNPTVIKWRINLYEKISKKDRALIEKTLIGKCKEFIYDKGNIDVKNNENNIKEIVYTAILRSYESYLSDQIKNEADLKYYLYSQIKKSLFELENQEYIVLVEFKIRQGNDVEAWFSRSNYQKKKHYFKVGYEIEDHNNFVKIKPITRSQIKKNSILCFNKQSDRSFKVDLVIVNKKTGRLLYLIELKFSSDLDLNVIKGDVVKFAIYNSIAQRKTSGIALGFNLMSKKIIVGSNDSNIQNELSQYLKNNIRTSSGKSSSRQNEKVSELSSSKLVKIAEQSLFNKEAFGGYDNFLESSWQAEFNYNIIRSIPAKYNLRNEFHLEGLKGRVDLIIGNDLECPKYIVEFKVHGENTLWEIKNKKFNERVNIDLFVNQMISLLKDSDRLSKNIIRKENFPDGYIFSSSFISKMVETYSQYRRIQNYISTYSGVKGYIFFTHWSTQMSDYSLKKYSISQREFNNCLNIREEVIKKIILLDKFTDNITFKYFNLLV